MALRLIKGEGDREHCPNTVRSDDESVRNHEILRQIEDAGVGHFWATDESGMLVYLSAGASKFLGKNANALLGLPLTTVFIDPDDEEDPNVRPLSFSLVSKSKIENQIVEIGIPSDYDESATISVESFKFIVLNALSEPEPPISLIEPPSLI